MQTANVKQQFNFKVPDFTTKTTSRGQSKACGQPVDTENIVTAKKLGSYTGII